MKNHLKRLVAPRSWLLDRAAKIFTVRPNPGAHSLAFGLPLGILLRDKLKVASSMSEVKKMLRHNEVLIDGTRRQDYRFMVGLFDVLSLAQQHYRLLLDKKGRLVLVAIPAAESSLKTCRIIGKKVLSKGKIQGNLHDGRNILFNEEIKVGDSVLLTLPQGQVQEVFPLKIGVAVLLIKGKHSGDAGILKEIKGNEAAYTVAGKDIETAKAYLFVVGNKEPAVTITPPITLPIIPPITSTIKTNVSLTSKTDLSPVSESDVSKV